MLISPYKYAQSNTIFVGQRAMPQPMLEKAFNWSSPEEHAFFQKPEEDKKKQSFFEKLADYKKATHELLFAANLAWKTKSYILFSKRLKKAYDSTKEPNELQRHVFTARGKFALPSLKNEILSDEYTLPQTRIEKITNTLFSPIRSMLSSAAELFQTKDNPEISSETQIDENSTAQIVFDYSAYIYDFFRDHFDFKIPQPMIMLVDINPFDLKFGFLNAALLSIMNYGLPMFLFGNGDHKNFNDLGRDISVIGHEYAHLLIRERHPEKFPMQGQSGALNEHLADVIGKCIQAKYEGWNEKLSGNQWKVGEIVFIKENMALRDMKNPGTAYDDPNLGKDTQPAHMKDYEILPTSIDAGGVHINNGIMNKLFAEFSERIDSPIYETPLKIWKDAMSYSRLKPSFFDFALALSVVAQEQGFKTEFMEAAKAVGIFEYIIVPGKLKARIIENPIIN